MPLRQPQLRRGDRRRRRAARPLQHVRPARPRALARAGDPATVALLRDAGRRIGEVVATAVNLLNPAVVVLGGDLVGADEPLIAGLREIVYQRATGLATRSLRIEPARLGEAAGLTGCAAMVLGKILSPEAIDSAR
ncbi:ROK family protein [Actinomadura sp. CNU-125]|uniref:ROK family protein n=1 Tax=Actinomadura sp. CNU-125 TaxID=1904961 RepID=UPI003967656A